MSASSRNRKVWIYPFLGTTESGYASNTYGPPRGGQAFWARQSPIVGNEGTTAGQADHTERNVFEFSDLTTVEHDDLLVDPEGVQWKVEGLALRRTRRQLIVHAFRSDDSPNATTA